MSEPDHDHHADADWAAIARDPRLASAIDSVRRVSGLRPEANAAPAAAPARKAEGPVRPKREQGPQSRARPAIGGEPRPEDDRAAVAPVMRRPGKAAAAEPEPTVRTRRLAGHKRLMPSLAMAAAVALLLHLAVIVAFGGGGTVVRAALEDGIDSLELSWIGEELTEPGTVLARVLGPAEPGGASPASPGS